MVRGRHGKLLEKFMGERSVAGVFAGILIAAVNFVIGHAFGYYDPQMEWLWLNLLTSFFIGIWLQRV